MQHELQGYVGEQKMSDWIPLKTRPMTEEEQQYYADHWAFTDSGFLDDDDKPQIFDCPLPEDGQEVLITVYGYVEVDTFIKDDNDGCYFECRDISDVKAWKPLPEPYKESEK